MGAVRKGIQVWAHRGLSGRYPENTLPAFKAAIDAGADGIECDLHMTLDGELVIMHDEEVSRTTNGFGNIGRMTYENVRHLDAGSWYAPKFAGVRVPHLVDLLVLLKTAARPVTLNIELKAPAGRYPGIESKVLCLLTQFNYESQTIFSSFEPSALIALAKVSPSVKLARLYGIDVDWQESPKLLERCTAIHPEFLGVDKTLMEQAHLRNKKVQVYTVNHREDVLHMQALGVHAVITDYPERVLKWVRKSR